MAIFVSSNKSTQQACISSWWYISRITCRSMDSYAYIWVYLHVQKTLRGAVHSRAGHYVCTFRGSTEQDTSISSGRRGLGCVLG